jgi:hypothetical protein
MKKLVTCFIILFFFAGSYAQNVGIGTTTPAGRLQINHRSANGPGLLLFDSTSNRSGLVIFRNVNNTRSIKVSGFTSSDFYNGQYLDIQTDSILTATFQGNGNVGIKNGSPQFPLDVTGTMNVNGLLRIPGLNLMEFGAGISSKETNAGKIGYNSFGQSALTFVGAGNNTTDRAIYFYAEGGTTMNGPLSFNGPLRINGNPGTVGQVLSSNGTGAAEWTNTSFSNNVRFAASFTTDVVPPENTNVYTSIYNLSPTDVTIATNVITINKTGLYRIEGYITSFANFTSAPSYLDTDLYLFADGIVLEFATGEEMRRISSTAFQYKKTIHFSQDVYLTAPGVIKPVVNVGWNGSLVSRGATGKITGYLISE